MEYRKLPHGEEQISIIGMGSAVIGEQPEGTIIDTVQYAVQQGINYFDLAAGHAAVFPAYGKALENCRKQVFLQVHFGANYTTGEYGWTTDLEEIKRSVDWQLGNLKTDYIDFGFIHCLDQDSDLSAYEKSGALQYVLDLQKQGVIRHLGLSSHTPGTAGRVLDLGVIDMLMFSINPMYDCGQGEFANGSAKERADLYRRCEKDGIAISVMKPFGAGMLLDAQKSPFGAALTPTQCIQYALDKPGVVTVLPGAGNREQLEAALHYLTAAPEERDYSVLGKLIPRDFRGTCVYCKHCHPCAMFLDIGLINKLYDLALLGDPMAKEHYLALDRTATDCIGCGQCSKRCPFRVDQMFRMRKIGEYFGK